MIEGTVRALGVEAGGQPAGELVQDSVYRFTYLAQAGPSEQISLGMPVQAAQYTRGALFPVFQMNLPEGYVRYFIAERLRKHAQVTDLLFLALAESNGVGRLTYRSGLDLGPAPGAVSLSEILSTDRRGTLFTELVETYLLRTTAGFAGVQPKVLVPEGKACVTTPNLIVKIGQAEYPGLAVNEFFCLSVARAAGIPVPEFWLSEDGERLVMRRFDLRDDGTRLGMEDFSVLLNRPGEMKYRGSYDTVLKLATHYEIDKAALFNRLALSLVLGDGDAHLKNFAVLYETSTGPLSLSPAYDVVHTAIYGDQSLALSLDRSRKMPTRKAIVDLGLRHGVTDAGERVENIVNAARQALCEQADRLAPHPQLRASLKRTITRFQGVRSSVHLAPT